MPYDLVHTLQLSLGQVAWAICDGQPPDPVTIDRLRYLRQWGVPFEKAGQGSGNRRRYGFDHLVECALAMYAIRLRYKPGEVATVQVMERKTLRKSARELFLAQPEAALSASWVKSRGRIIPILKDEPYLRLHDRFSETPGTFEVVSEADLIKGPKQMVFGDIIERYPSGDTRPLIPMLRVMLPAVAWALEAPATRPGRR